MGEGDDVRQILMTVAERSRGLVSETGAFLPLKEEEKK